MAMRNKLLIAGVLVLLTLHSFAQTKLIAHKSHSGSNENFKTALNKNLFDSENSNFGERHPISPLALDSIVFVSDTITVLVYSKSKSSEKNKSERYTILKDTLYNHPILSQKHSKDRIRNFLIKESYPLNQSVDSIPFVEHQKTEKGQPQKSKKKGSLYLVPQSDTNHQPPFDTQKLVLVSFAGLFAIVAGFVSLKWKQLKFRS